MGINKRIRKFLNQLDLTQIPAKYKEVFAELQQGNTEPMRTQFPDMYFAYFGMEPKQKTKAFALTSEIVQQEIKEADNAYEEIQKSTAVRKPSEATVYVHDETREAEIIRSSKDAMVIDEFRYLIYNNSRNNKKLVIGMCSIVSKSDILRILASEKILVNEKKCFRIKMNYLAKLFHLNNIQEFNRKKTLPLCEKLARKYIYEVDRLARELEKKRI